MKSQSNHDFSISFDRSEVDGVPVLHIDTPNLNEDANGPICRIYLNDEPLFENPVFPGMEENILDEIKYIFNAGLQNKRRRIEQKATQSLRKYLPQIIKTIKEQASKGMTFFFIPIKNYKEEGIEISKKVASKIESILNGIYCKYVDNSTNPKLYFDLSSLNEENFTG